MCGRYTLTTPGGRALAERFDVADPDAVDPAPLGRTGRVRSGGAAAPPPPAGATAPAATPRCPRGLPVRCGRYTLTPPGGRALAERFDVAAPAAAAPATLGRFNVCPTEPIAIV